MRLSQNQKDLKRSDDSAYMGWFQIGKSDTKYKNYQSKLEYRIDSNLNVFNKK